MCDYASNQAGRGQVCYVTGRLASRLDSQLSEYLVSLLVVGLSVITTFTCNTKMKTLSFVDSRVDGNLHIYTIMCDFLPAGRLVDCVRP